MFSIYVIRLAFYWSFVKVIEFDFGFSGRVGENKVDFCFL